MTRNNARLPDAQTLIGLGLNPITGSKIAQDATSPLKEKIRTSLRIMDEQQFLSRYSWYGLPYGLSPDLMERILYYRGCGAFFYVDELERFFFLPFALTQEIDCYGRYKKIIPLPFTGTNSIKDANGKLKEFLPGMTRDCQYDIQIEDMTFKDFTDKAVILTDYCKQLSQTIIPRQQINEAIIDIESDFIPYMRTALMNSTGVTGMKVGNQDEQADVAIASEAVHRASLNGEKWIPIVSSLQLEGLSSDNVQRSEEFLLAMQSIDNFRQMLIGLGDGNLFQTKSHMLQTQADMAIGRTDGILSDGLKQRQEFCNIVNSIWGIGIWCEVSETAGDYDANMDGVQANEQDQSGSTTTAPEGSITDVDGE